MRQLARTVTDQDLQVALERVEAIAGNTQRMRGGSGVEYRQYPFDCLHQIRPYPAPVAALMKPFHAAMLETPNH